MREAPGQSLRNPQIPSLGATHQLLCGCVLDESGTVARLPRAHDPHPWEMQGKRCLQHGRAWESTQPRAGPMSAPRSELLPQGSVLRRTHSAGLVSALRSSGRRSPDKKGLGGRGPGFQAYSVTPSLQNILTPGAPFTVKHSEGVSGVGQA